MAGTRASFQKNALLRSGVLEYATNYDGATFNEANKNTSITTIESTYNFVNVGLFTDFNINHAFDNERIINTDTCSIGEVDRSSEIVGNCTYNWQEVNDIDIFAAFLGLTVENVAGTATTVTNEALGTNVNAEGTILFLDNANGDGTVVTSFTLKLDGTAVGSPDFTLAVDDGSLGKKGRSYVVIRAAQIGALTADYTYTPSTSKITGYKVQSRSIPGQLLKFTTCANEDGESDVFYLVNAKVNDTVTMQFINRDTTDLTGASMSHQLARGGNYFERKETLV